MDAGTTGSTVAYDGDEAPLRLDAGMRPARHWGLRIFGLLALIFFGLGAYDHVMVLSGNAAYLARFDARALDYLAEMPGWVIGGWSASIWGGLLGAVLLLARRKWAREAFLLSFAGLIVCAVWQFALSRAAPSVLAEPASILVTALIWLVTLALTVYSVDMRRRGILR